MRRQPYRKPYIKNMASDGRTLLNYVLGLKCIKCGAEFPTSQMFEGCPRCKTNETISNITVVYDYDKIANILEKMLKRSKNRIWRYQELLPIQNEKHMLCLGEGNTPLWNCKHLGLKIDIENLYVKDESRNPTWSFKDRLCCTAVSKGLDFGADRVIALSTGNHGASTAAYAAVAGMKCLIFASPSTPKTMLIFMQAYGALVVQTEVLGSWSLMRKCVQDYGWYPTSSYTRPTRTTNPYGIEGYKTISYEICEQLQWEPPDKVFIPSGSGDALFGVWKGFSEFKEFGLIDKIPAIIGVETAAGGPLTNSITKNLDYLEEVKVKSTVATSISTGVASYHGLWALRKSNGTAITVTDKEILEAQKKLSMTEGLFVEPASAAAFAGVEKLVQTGELQRDETIVCVLTSTGLKDPESLSNYLSKMPIIEPEWKNFTKAIKEVYNFQV